MSKTPFEIRADILQMAKDYLDSQYAANLALAEQMVAAGEKTWEDVQEMSKMYTPEELMSQAEDFYRGFVTPKK